MFKVSFQFEQLKIEKYALSVYQSFRECFKEFPFEYSVLKLDFSTLWIKSQEFTKYPMLYFISSSWTIINGKYRNYRLIIKFWSNIQISSFLSLNSIKRKNVFFHIPFDRFNSLVHTNHSYIRIISCRIVKLANKPYVTSSQGNYISIFVSKTSPFPKQNWFRDHSDPDIKRRVDNRNRYSGFSF